MLLFVVDDHHAERALRTVLGDAHARTEAPVVLTADALLAMRLRRDGYDARLTTDGLTRETMAERDRVALEGVASATAAGARDYAAALGTSYGPYLQYTLIPAFVRAVRNITALDAVLASAGPQPPIIVLVGGGPLVDAARLLAGRRGIATETAGGDVLERAAQALARLRAGRATKWVNTDFRALVLEPGFLWSLFLKGLWRRLTSPPPPTAPRALIVVGDRFTSDVVERLRGEARPIVLAGATQPGRALFEKVPGLVPIEAYTEWTDVLRWAGWAIDAVASAISLTADQAHARRFVVPALREQDANVPYWPLVGRSVWLHVAAWVPALRHLQALGARAAGASPGAALLTSTDVTAYNRVLIDTVRRFGIRSTAIQHGMTGQPNGHSVVHADRLAAWGDETEPWYRRHATQQAEFVVTGNPRFDGLAARIPNPDRIPTPESRMPFTVTVCTGFVTDFSVAATEYANLIVLDAVIDWARRHPGTTVIHKMHPGEEIAYYAQAARALGWDPLTLKTIKEPILYDVLERSDVLVAEYSTTVLESVALGTPAIVLDAIVRCRLLPLDEIPGIGIALSIDELHAQLTARLSAGAKATASRDDPRLVRYIGQLDGGAAERIAALLRGD